MVHGAIPILPPTRPADPPTAFGPQRLFLDDVPWDFYTLCLNTIRDKSLRVTFHRGRLEIMAPLSEHEIWKRAIGRFIEQICFERDIPFRAIGSTTVRRDDRQAGLESDEAFYVQRAAAVVGKMQLDFTVDPAPDLAVEIDITRRSVPRQPIYADLGVPELWRFDGQRLSVLALTPAGRYEERERSIAFPFLPMDEFRRFLEMTRTTDDTTAMRAFQQWVRTLTR
ncbi:MAG: Uma2 family endonuclease [Phycisphaerae bacterium]|nr:Uma2 family endonuclease [Tepidisphaeraceae bacterium]